MTMHLPGYDPAPRRRAGVTTIREDVHLHVALTEVRSAISDPANYRAWLTDAMSAYEGDSEGFRFDLGLPGRTETFSMRRVPTDDAREVVFKRDAGGAAEMVTWALYPEGPRECHVTLEVAYQPASGLLGGAMETLMHRPQRIQMLRDFLWALKRDVEPARNEDFDGTELDGTEFTKHDTDARSEDVAG